MPPRIRKAVFPVAGLGTRILPATKSIPKEMLPVVDKPLIQYAVEEAAASGIEEFIFVTGRGKAALEDHFDRAYELEAMLAERGKVEAVEAVRSCVPSAGRIAYTRQPKPLGLGHAVHCARALVGEEPFAVLLPDDLVLSKTPCLRQLIDVYEETGGNVVAVVEVPADQVRRYGILVPGPDDGRRVEVRGLVEKPEPAAAPSRLAVIGRYLLSPGVMASLAQAGAGHGGEIQLTDALAARIGHEPLHGLRFEGRRIDCGDAIGLLQANLAVALERADLGEAVRAAIEDELSLGLGRSARASERRRGG
ncbi:MAG TPA: UTP--glucose-1-phosphate uridylyltransferase GalU [Alphaproteobacteria bacterium]|nr:UTP--glucose-1-phosphate uridylyltransferase GalU [Alphaproteobacteria bacterium]